MTEFAKTTRLKAIRSQYGTPVWHVYGENARSLALGSVWRADGNTWVAQGTHFVAGLSTKTAAEAEVRRQWDEYEAARINVFDFGFHRRRRHETRGGDGTTEKS